MQKLILLLTAFILIANNSNAQLQRTWKRQIYGGLGKTLRSENVTPTDNYDMTFVSKSDWLFNVGFNYSKFRIKLDIPSSGGFRTSALPMASFRQFNFSVGKRVDLSPKWGLSLYPGISYTHYTYPTIADVNTTKYGVYIPVTLSTVGAVYETKRSIGLHLNSELNFYVCDNIQVYLGYMYDLNSAHITKGFFLGGRMGVMKQKHGSRRISARATF